MGAKFLFIYIYLHSKCAQFKQTEGRGVSAKWVEGRMREAARINKSKQLKKQCNSKEPALQLQVGYLHSVPQKYAEGNGFISHER